MSKKPDTASALASIIGAKRGEERAVEPVAPVVSAPVAATSLPPSPAPLPPAPVAIEKPSVSAAKRPAGKSKDKATFTQCSVYLKKDTRKKVGRALEDAETGQDFSDLVQVLLEQWLKSRT